VSFNKSAAANPALGHRLAPAAQNLVNQAHSTMQLANEKIVLSDTLDFSGPEYVKATTDAINAQFSANELASKELKGLLEAQIADLRNTR
jgi:hypothetical protein